MGVMTQRIDGSYVRRGVWHNGNPFSLGGNIHAIPLRHDPVAQEVMFLLTLEAALRDKRASEGLGDNLLRKSIDAALRTMLRLDEGHWLRTGPEICAAFHSYVGLGPRDGSTMVAASDMERRMEWLRATYNMSTEELNVLSWAITSCGNPSCTESGHTGILGARKFFAFELERNRALLEVPQS